MRRPKGARKRKDDWTGQPCWLPDSDAPRFQERYGVPPGAELQVITDENGSLLVEWPGNGARFMVAKSLAMPAPPGLDPLAGAR